MNYFKMGMRQLLLASAWILVSVSAPAQTYQPAMAVRSYVKSIHSSYSKYHNFFKGFLRSDTSTSTCSLRYSQTAGSISKDYFWFQDSTYNYEVYFANDSVFEVSPDDKRIIVDTMSESDFIDNYNTDLFFPICFLAAPEFGDRCYDSSKTHTLVTNDTGMVTTSFCKYESDPIFDSQLTTRCFSPSRESATNYSKVTWSSIGNEYRAQQELFSRYSSSYDTVLHKEIEHQIYSLIHDSGYIVISPEEYRKKSRIPDSLSAIKIGLPFPPLKLLFQDGTPVNIFKDSAKFYVFEFWHMGCLPCIQSIPDMNTFWERYKDSSVAFIGINVSTSDRKEKAIYERFKAKFKLRFPVVFAGSKETHDRGIDGYPMFVIVNTNGIIVHIFHGFASLWIYNMLCTKMEHLLHPHVKPAKPTTAP